jgi:type IV secretion system protein VirD4
MSTSSRRLRWPRYVFLGVLLLLLPGALDNREVYFGPWVLVFALWLISFLQGDNDDEMEPPQSSGRHGTACFGDGDQALANNLIVHGWRTYACIAWPVIGRLGNGPLLQYPGDRHLLTVAPTRSGKGVGTVIPNLLGYPGSILVIDPKGENAKITAAFRQKIGHAVYVLDPFGVTGLPSSRFNPLDFLAADSADLAEDAMTLADALVIPGSASDQFWSDEAKAMIFAMIVHVVTDPDETDRSLGRVRELLSLPLAEFGDLVERMQQSGNGLVRRAAGRIGNKADRELSSVLSTAQQNTYFLESSRMADSLSATDFAFADMRRRPMTVYLVLPPERLGPYNRWLRLLINMALITLHRHPGRMASIETAYGVAAGLGIQCWVITQDFNQLEALYGANWRSFIGNSGVVQAFGTRDLRTAQELSNMLGVTTVEVISEYTARQRRYDPHYRSVNDREFGRQLATPDEIMRMNSGVQLLFLDCMAPMIADKIQYYNHPYYSYLVRGGLATLHQGYGYGGPQAPMRPALTWRFWRSRPILPKVPPLPVLSLGILPKKVKTALGG